MDCEYFMGPDLTFDGSTYQNALDRLFVGPRGLKYA